MKLNKLFPKKNMDEIFIKYGFNRQKSTEFIVYANQFNSSVIISRPRFQNGIFFLDCNAISNYNLNIEGFKREWGDEEFQACSDYIKNTLLPQISPLKGPFKIEPDYYFKKTDELFSKHIGFNGARGNKDFTIPFRGSEKEVNYDYLKFDIEEDKTIFFLNKHRIYKIYIVDYENKKAIYNWHMFADKDKEGDELLTQMVDNIAKFLKLKDK